MYDKFSHKMDPSSFITLSHDAGKESIVVTLDPCVESYQQRTWSRLGTFGEECPWVFRHAC